MDGLGGAFFKLVDCLEIISLVLQPIFEILSSKVTFSYVSRGCEMNFHAMIVLNCSKTLKCHLGHRACHA